MTLVPGQRVETRLHGRPGHTRLPIYARGRKGTVAAERGSFPFADDIVRLGRADPQPLYSVRFASRDLWGPDVESHAVHLDLFEDYLQPIDAEGAP
jgi:nitrile hydratase subunit beta